MSSVMLPNDRPSELVAELRWLADPNRGSAAYGLGELYNMLDRAADEIERLLEENERLKRKLRECGHDEH
jgi:hypothetical protein